MTQSLQKGTENEILRTVSKPVKSVTPELRTFALEMIKTMERENGVGLAAPQVGRNIRVVICMFNPGEKNEVTVPMVNPEFLELSEEIVDGEEGCLSLPGIWGKVPRARRVLLRFLNLKNQSQTLELHDFNARVIQHEMDHINGVLFVDRAHDIEEKALKKRAKSAKHI